MAKDIFVPENEELSSATSLTLLYKVRHKDKDAWNRLVSLYTPLVCFWCKSWNLQQADLEDVVQEVFVTVFRYLATFRRDREGDSFRKWLKTITRTRLASRVTPAGGKGQGGSDAQHQLQELPALDIVEDDDRETQTRERNILYHRAIELIESNFEPKTRRAFWLLISGLKPKEVAAELKMSTSAV